MVSVQGTSLRSNIYLLHCELLDVSGSRASAHPCNNGKHNGANKKIAALLEVHGVDLLQDGCIPNTSSASKGW